MTFSLRILGNFCYCRDEITQKVIDEGLVKELKRLLSHHSTSIRKDAVWTISNIAVGSQNQIECLVEENIFSLLKDMAKREFNIIRKEAIWAICNLTNIRNPYHAETLIEQGILESLINFLKQPNPKFVVISLEAITNFLELESIFHNVKIYIIYKFYTIRKFHAVLILKRF